MYSDQIPDYALYHVGFVRFGKKINIACLIRVKKGGKILKSIIYKGMRVFRGFWFCQ